MSAASQSGWDVVSDDAAPAGGQPQPQPQAQPQQGGAQQGSEWDVVSDEPEKQPPKSPTDFLLNRVPHSFYNFFSNIGSAIAHPIKTDEALTNTIQGALKYAGRAAGLDLPEDESDHTAKAFGQYLYNRYGSWEKAGESLYNDPVGTLADASTAITGAGGAIRGASTLAKAAGAARTAETVGAVGRGVSTLGKVVNPLYVPSQIVSAPLRPFMPKKAPPAPGEVDLPAFDPETGTFKGPPMKPPEDAGPAFDPKTATVEGQPPDDPVARLRQQWGIKNPPSGLGKPQAPAQATPPPPAAVPPAVPSAGSGQQVWSTLKQAGIGGLAGEVLFHSLTGMAGGVLTAGALKLLPMFLKSETGQRMLSTIGPGSNAATVAAVARDMAPALNAFARNYQASMSQPSVFDRARGGMVNPELARIQRERLRLPGILETLGNVK